jgi:hypothetical protein
MARTAGVNKAVKMNFTPKFYVTIFGPWKTMSAAMWGKLEKTDKISVVRTLLIFC